MKVTVHIEREVGYFPHDAKRTEIVVDCRGMEFTPNLTANFLRAVADEIAPRYEATS